jgi:hypothetical protein
MNTGPHGRARDLIARDRIEGISAAENAWLESHLAECSGCSEIAETTAGALRAVRAFSVTLPPELAERARLRLYWHTSQQGQNRPRQRALWAACVVSWIGGAATSPFVWRGFEWIGRQAGVPDPVWKMGFALWWGLPALFAAAALFLHPTALAAYRRR